ncbi:hypothetical protein QYE76_041800 [Lolium multiflorum]|uniref:CCHC-type domain-containing protein n=1 Tax=Lolium multiflorum TaxID=4521 RepID=A0AAD8TFJ9_LOLMU|nr:hypothetical protein QYE76_041800 [Lolium multiflorum]
MVIERKEEGKEQLTQRRAYYINEALTESNSGTRTTKSQCTPYSVACRDRLPYFHEHPSRWSPTPLADIVLNHDATGRVAKGNNSTSITSFTSTPRSQVSLLLTSSSIGKKLSSQLPADLKYRTLYSTALRTLKGRSRDRPHLTKGRHVSTFVVTNHVGEIEELEAQVTSLKKDLVKGHEGKQSPNDKGGLGFKSNNKNKSTTHKRKKGHGHVKDPAKIVCFKCKIEGHHVRLCPLKKKPLGEKKQGKRPQDGAHGLPQGQAQGLPRLEERPLPKKDQAKAPVVEKSSEKKEKRRTCYICHEKGHISSFCTIGPNLVGDH